jgi:glycosyltransferase involved in cell wall biosynthesis
MNTTEHSMLFSIGIPAYKANYLAECIDSVLNQNYTNFELIIVNDASPENLDAIVENYNDSRIQYYKNSVNYGAENVVDNWNKCLSYAKGDYFLLLGDDDLLESNYLEEFSKTINFYSSLDVFHCQSYIINEDSDKIDITTALPDHESTIENIWHRVHQLRQQYISDFVYRRSQLVANGGFYKLPLAWGSDDISSYIAMGVKGIAHINIPLLNYRRSSVTISSSSQNTKLKVDAIVLVDIWLQYFLDGFKGGIKETIIKTNLNIWVPKYTKKKKIQAISSSFNGGLVVNFFHWFFNRKKIEVSIVEIFYALLIYFGNKFK